MLDVPDFIRKAQEIYGYAHLVNDVGGSLCELDEPRVIDLLAEHSLILYIRVPEADEIKLIQRAQADPKPLYYRPEFLRTAVKEFLSARELEYVAQIDPDDFTRWVFPRLFPLPGAALRGHRPPPWLYRLLGGGGPGPGRAGLPAAPGDRHRPGRDRLRRQPHAHRRPQ
jgi:hypothetical protein